ncbi:MAG: hypothetical protein SF339_17545 [Blastocatellia bacterium]|nr:hypothetical protein [Blastocatellia bacterium]
MNALHQTRLLPLFRSCAGVLLWVVALSLGITTLAQSSVEKSETSQQAKEPENELERAKAAVAKPNEPKIKPETGRQWGIYSTTSSIEIGHRFVDTKGSRDRYLSDVNVRDGFRVLEYSLDMRARPGTGILFDTFKADVNNAGGDVAQNFSLRMDKTRFYRFDANVRRFNYFRSLGPNFALGLRDTDIRQQVSDYSLRLFPQRAVRVNFGYGRNMATGRFAPSYSYERDAFKLPSQTRWEANDYRAGLDATWRKWDFGFESFYRGFRNDPDIRSREGRDPGYFGDSGSFVGALTFLERDTPLRSRSIVTRANVRGSIGDRLHVLLRGLHDDERMNAPYVETTAGTAFSNARIISRVLTAQGFVERPGNIVDGGVTLDINRHFSISNLTNYTHFRIEGDTLTSQTSVQQPTTGAQQTILTTTAGNRFTEWESLWNTLSLNMTYGKKFSANLGWRFMKRDIELNGLYTSRTSTSTNVTSLPLDDSESINTNAFIGGFRVRPTNRTSFMFDVETGENNNSFVRINPLEYTRFRVRAQVQATDKLGFNGTFTSLDRTNPTPQVVNDSDMRSYTVAMNWEPKSRLMLDVGYDYHDLFSTANISYFVTGSQLRTGRSLYYARMNSVFANTRFGVTDRLDLFLVYYYIMDRGAPTISVGATDLVNAYPLRRHNPEARVAYRFSNNVTGNVSYRHYSYNEREFSVQDYRSNILTTSLRFTF